jgi:hypothetical protein
MGVQARNVVREANKMGFTFERGNYIHCAVGFLSQKTHVNNIYNRQAIAVDLGLVKPNQTVGPVILWAIELGFEDYSTRGMTKRGVVKRLRRNWQAGSDTDLVPDSKLYRYYHVGRNIARKAGLPLGRRER